jgi:alanine racemase
MVMAVLKADAYGHGAVPVARELEAQGCGYFAVATLEEAKLLRKAGIEASIIILGFTPPGFGSELSELGITQAVGDLASARILAEGAKHAHKTLKIHIKLDTGMGRFGFSCRDGCEKVLDDILAACSLEGLEPEGVFTHFALADAPDDPFTMEQFRRFTYALDKLEERGRRFKIRHASNSGAIMYFPETILDAVRPGIILYGLRPDARVKETFPLVPAMSLVTTVVRADTLRKGEGLGYGLTFTAERDMPVATLAAGYADGYSRRLSDLGEVFINGKRAKVRGRVCMDMCMAQCEAKVGDVATLFGKANDCDITLDELAEKLGTISYELACLIGSRVPRIYCKDGKEVLRV